MLFPKCFTFLWSAVLAYFYSNTSCCVAFICVVAPSNLSIYFMLSVFFSLECQSCLATFCSSIRFCKCMHHCGYSWKCFVVIIVITQDLYSPNDSHSALKYEGTVGSKVTIHFKTRGMPVHFESVSVGHSLYLLLLCNLRGIKLISVNYITLHPSSGAPVEKKKKKEFRRACPSCGDIAIH